MHRPSVPAAALLLLAMLLRALCLDHETLDYQNFLTKWVDYYRTNGTYPSLDEYKTYLLSLPIFP